MRPLSSALILAALALTAACSKTDQSAMSRDAKDAAQSAKAEAGSIAHDANWQRTQADLKRLGHDVAADTRKGFAEAKGATNSMVHDAQHGAKQAGERQEQSDKRSDNNS